MPFGPLTSGFDKTFSMGWVGAGVPPDGMNLATCKHLAHLGNQFRALQVGYKLGISWVQLGYNWGIKRLTT